MRAPRFWSVVPPTPMARLLAPLGALYGAVAARRMDAEPTYRAHVPVVCIGNFTAGGSGKTPVVRALAALLAEMGFGVAILSRGYGGRLSGPVVVDPDIHTAADVGDEPLMLGRDHSVVVSADRPAGAILIAESDATVIVMDDGLQNPSLAKTLSFAVVDAEAGFGNGLCHPAGPLRAPLHRQAPHVDGAILVGAGDLTSKLGQVLGTTPVFAASLAVENPEAVSGKRVFGFCGIGRPDKFRRSLEEAGADVVKFRAFPDHHPFSETEAVAILAEAEAGDLVPVTTEKDAVRLCGGPQRAALLETAIVLGVQIQVEDAEGFRAFVAARLPAP